MTRLMLQDARTFMIGALLSAIAFMIASFLYTRYVRPRLLAAGKLDFEVRWTTWIKNRWDLVGAGVIGVFAGVWNFALDLAVVLFHVADNVFPVLATVDLTPFTLPDWVRTTIQLAGALLPAIRAGWAAAHRQDGG